MQLKQVTDHSLDGKNPDSNHIKAIEYTEEIGIVPEISEQSDIYYTETMDLRSQSDSEMKLRLITHFINDFDFNFSCDNCFN